MSTEKTDGHQQGTVEVDAEQVLDADDYSHNRAVREIMDARADVRETVKEMETNERDGASIPVYQVTELAQQTAMYAYEVLPLVRKSDLPHDATELPEEHPHRSIETFAGTMGMHPSKDGEPCGVLMTVQVYDSCNRIVDELGIGVSLDKSGDGLEL